MSLSNELEMPKIAFWRGTLALCLLMLGKSAYATTTRLMCDLEITKTSLSGENTLRDKIIVTVEEAGSVTTISADSKNLSFMMTTKMPGGFSEITNQKWDLNYLRKEKDSVGGKVGGGVVIDRVTGHFHYEGIGKVMHTEAEGYCSKYTSSKPLF